MSKSNAIILRNLPPQPMPQPPALPQQDSANAELPSGNNVATVDNLPGKPGGRGAGGMKRGLLPRRPKERCLLLGSVIEPGGIDEL